MAARGRSSGAIRAGTDQDFRARLRIEKTPSKEKPPGGNCGSAPSQAGASGGESSTSASGRSPASSTTFAVASSTTGAAAIILCSRAASSASVMSLSRLVIASAERCRSRDKGRLMRCRRRAARRYFCGRVGHARRLPTPPWRKQRRNGAAQKIKFAAAVRANQRGGRLIQSSDDFLALPRGARAGAMVKFVSSRTLCAVLDRAVQRKNTLADWRKCCPAPPVTTYFRCDGGIA